ncbi:MAG: glycoside hydrolase family 1 protein [bacterium]|nr:glycoside hydrolase family 1 protein [bacterium]
MHYKFPESFYFGASTSAHQVEGANRNDWTEWEHANARRLAQIARVSTGNTKRSAISDRHAFARNLTSGIANPLNPKNYISGLASDHYRRFNEDFDIAKSLGHNAHRFSIEWSRIEPEEGKWSERELAHYKEVIRALRARNLEPFVTLWHFTLPIWLAEKGGVLNPRFPYYFNRYAQKVAHALGADVHFWLTINEPEIYALNAYGRGSWPPGKEGLANYYRALTQMIGAHHKAYRTIRKHSLLSKVGVACNLSYFESAGGPVNAVIKRAAEELWNFHFLSRTTKSLDFIGLNYYFRNRVNYGLNKNPHHRVSDMGWDLHPEGIRPVLQGLAHFKKPIYVTENGLADAEDTHRPWFIEKTLHAIAEAMYHDNVDVRGYFYWSLLDNFEWDKGFWPRFGLVEVDYETFARKVRPSAETYKKIIKNGLVL